MATAKKSVKKYKDGGSKTSRLDKRIAKTVNKRDALSAQQREDAPLGMGDAWVKMDPKIQRLTKKADRLSARKPTAQKGGTTKMKRGGVAKKR